MVSILNWQQEIPEVVNYKLEVMQALKLDDQIEDILITLVSQYHLIRLLESSNDLFLYLVLERSVQI